MPGRPDPDVRDHPGLLDALACVAVVALVAVVQLHNHLHALRATRTR